MSQQDKDTETIYLLKPHRHAGREYPPGATLELPESKAVWLVGLSVASKTPPVITPATPKEA